MRLVETLYGKYAKYTIYRENDFLGRTMFYVYRDGKSYYSCSSLAHAVDYVRSRDGG